MSIGSVVLWLFLKPNWVTIKTLLFSAHHCGLCSTVVQPDHFSRQQPHFWQYSRVRRRAQHTGWQPRGHSWLMASNLKAALPRLPTKRAHPDNSKWMWIFFQRFARNHRRYVLLYAAAFGSVTPNRITSNLMATALMLLITSLLGVRRITQKWKLSEISIGVFDVQKCTSFF